MRYPDGNTCTWLLDSDAQAAIREGMASPVRQEVFPPVNLPGMTRIVWRSTADMRQAAEARRRVEARRR